MVEIGYWRARRREYRRALVSKLAGWLLLLAHFTPSIKWNGKERSRDLHKRKKGEKNKRKLRCLPSSRNKRRVNREVREKHECVSLNRSCCAFEISFIFCRFWIHLVLNENLHPMKLPLFFHTNIWKYVFPASSTSFFLSLTASKHVHCCSSSNWGLDQVVPQTECCCCLGNWS